MSGADVPSLQRRSLAGDARAQVELGKRLLVGRNAPFAPQDAINLIEAAAKQNNTEALQFSAVLAAAGIGRPQDWNAAFDFMRCAADQGDANAKAQLTIVGDRFADQLKIPDATQHFDAPRVLTLEGFLAPGACAWIMDRARPSLDAARVKNAEQGGANVHALRTNTGMGFSLIDTDLVIQLTHARIAAAIGQPVSHQEPTNILHYTPGQEYRPHFDFIDPGVAHFARELQTVGQRTTTFLIYLNDDYDGGATTFPRLDWSFKGKVGDALAFWNITDGRPDPLTLHAGTPTSSGIKWLFSKWVRDRPLPLV
ncbi:MAG: 2OG-Fe(II) oxygenase [Alphaproteobacteria bacterium]|nr:2OG-Fe(II) oxygenase [Alphaproteobacteria bacterium]